mgnify:CR=1 FL=1
MQIGQLATEAGVAIDTVPITPHVLSAAFSKAGLIHDSWKEEK